MFTVDHILTLFLRVQVGIWTVLGVQLNLISLGIVLKCLEDTSEKACDADGVRYLSPD
jgi:hypothetical protein